MQKCVSRLRRLLSGTGVPPQVIVTDPNGYRIELPPGSLDLHEFRERWQRAREAAAAEDLHAASELYRDCLSLWRGPALADIDNQRLRDAAAVVDEERYAHSRNGSR